MAQQGAKRRKASRRADAGAGEGERAQGARSLAERLADEVWTKRAEGLPEDVLRQVVVRVVDTLGVALAGAVYPPGRAAASILGPFAGEGGGATIWATGARAAAAEAAFANSVAAHALDYDDSSADTVTHTGAIAVPVALAMAEDRNAGARETLTAIACGYQVADFVERIAHHEFQQNGFQSAAIAGLFGGVTVAACMEDTGAAALANAFGIAGSMAAGLMEFLIVGGDTKPIQVGWAAHAGIFASRLAASGMRGPRTVFEGRYGLYNSYLKKQLQEDVVRAEPLWDRYAVMRTSTKPYPTCLGINAAADAWSELANRLRAGGMDPARDVRSLHCEVPEFAARLVLDPISSKRRPQTSHEARFSLPYCLARIALDGRLNLGSFTDEKLHAEEARAFMDKVSYSLLEDRGTRAIVRVDCGDGEVMEERMGPLSGEPHEWTTEEQLREKFLDAGADLARTGGDLAELYEAARRIYETDSLNALFDRLHRFHGADHV